MIQRRSENPKEKDRVRDHPGLYGGIPWNGTLTGKVFQQRKTSQRASPLKRMFVPNGMPVITGVHLSVPFIKKELRTWE